MKTIQWDQGVLEPERNGEPNRAVYQGLESPNEYWHSIISLA